MLRVLKVALVSILVVLLISAMCEETSRTIVSEKAFEGMAGGILAGLVMAFSKLERAKPGFARVPRLILLLVRHEVCAGLVGGFLVGLTIAIILCMR